MCRSRPSLSSLPHSSFGLSSLSDNDAILAHSALPQKIDSIVTKNQQASNHHALDYRTRAQTLEAGDWIGRVRRRGGIRDRLTRWNFLPGLVAAVGAVMDILRQDVVA